MEAYNVCTQSKISVEERTLEVKAERVVLASRRGESGAVVDEVNVEYILKVGDKFEFCLELSVGDDQTPRVPPGESISRINA